MILCLHECFPIDARAIRAATGVITLGGNIFRHAFSPLFLYFLALSTFGFSSRLFTSNAAVLCRGMGKPCVTSVRDMCLTLQDNVTVLSSTAARYHIQNVLTIF